MELDPSPLMGKKYLIYTGNTTQNTGQHLKNTLLFRNFYDGLLTNPQKM